MLLQNVSMTSKYKVDLHKADYTNKTLLHTHTHNINIKYNPANNSEQKLSQIHPSLKVLI